MTTRTAVLASAVAAALLASVTAPASQAAEPVHTPVPSSVRADAFSTPEATVWSLDAYPHTGIDPIGTVCLTTAHITADGHGTRTITNQGGCGHVAYRFDAVGWLTTVDGAFSGFHWVEVQRWDGQRWVRTSMTETEGEITVDLRWRGKGYSQPDPAVHGPGCGYACSRPHASASRDAEVAGTIGLGGSGATIVVPPGHAGTMTVGG